MAKPYDAIITAVHYDAEGKVQWVRAHLRRWGVAYGDRVILAREALIDQLQSGKRVAVGHRKRFFGNSFEIEFPVRLQSNGEPRLIHSPNDQREIDGAPVL